MWTLPGAFWAEGEPQEQMPEGETTIVGAGYVMTQGMKLDTKEVGHCIL